MSNELTAARDSLGLALPIVKQSLSKFIADVEFDSQISLAFGLSLQHSDRAREIIAQWLAGEGILPTTEILSSSLINCVPEQSITSNKKLIPDSYEQ